jgi:alpha-D-ribose 1-methylphosphonate 5-triphosphate synthase subunit PhnG
LSGVIYSIAGDFTFINVSNSSTILSDLSRADAGRLKELVERLLPALGEITVLKNRTGILMLPAIDSVQGVQFHVGEVLVAEAHVRLDAAGVEGFGACVGRDLHQALAIAIADASLRAGVFVEEIREFARAEHERLLSLDRELLARVAATRVEMETF